MKLLVLLAGLCATAVAVAPGSWADSGDLAVAYQVDVAHSGVQTDRSLVPPFVRRWRATLPAQVSYPLIAEGRVFVTAGDRSATTRAVYALDQATGAVLWSQPLPIFWWWSNAAYDNGRVFVVGADNPACCPSGLLFAYSAATGELLWTRRLPGQDSFTAPPTAANGVVYTSGSGEGGTLYAVRESDGQILATQPVEGGDRSSPAVSDDGVFVSYACDQTYGFAQGSLVPLWHYSTPCQGNPGHTAVYAGGRLYTRDSYGDLVLDALTGGLVRNWGLQAGGSGGSVPAIDENGIYSTIGHQLTAQALDGTPLWTFFGDGTINTAPLILNSGVGRIVIAGGGSGQLYALDTATGAEIWTTNVGAGITATDEWDISVPLAGLGIGQGLIVVPAGRSLMAYTTDTTPPVISTPGVVTATATSSAGATVSYSVTASDPDDSATLHCAPPSGSTFPIGATTVRCNAVDTSGNTANAEFLVVVAAANADCRLSDYASSKGSLMLKNANLSGCYLAGANLARANATNTNMVATYLDGADLSSANLSQANLRGAVLAHANLSAAVWSQTTCPDGTISGASGGTCIGHLG